MAIDRDIVERAAKIAHLNLDSDELDKYSKDLSDILDYFEMLDEIPGEDTEGFTPIPVEDVLREDVPSMDIPSEDVIKGMNIYNGYVRGPRLS